VFVSGNMKRVFGVKKDKEPPPSIQDSSDRVTFS
jgi:charged multivesicular body protein 5